MRIAWFLPSGSPDGQVPAISPVTAEVVGRLRDRGVRVDLVVPGASLVDLAALRPQHDLYVLKSKSPLALSLAGSLALAGAVVVNDFRASVLARDKIATTAVLAAAGVPVPPSWATGRASLLHSLLDESPLWLKPQQGSQGAGVRRLGRRGDLDGPEVLADPHGLPLPLFVQQEVPTGGPVLKVYVIGDHLWAIAKPWPARMANDKIGTPVPLLPAVGATALACGRALGLGLYGVDFLMAAERSVVVDVNAFPGYKGVGDAPRYLADYLYERGR